MRWRLPVFLLLLSALAFSPLPAQLADEGKAVSAQLQRARDLEGNDTRQCLAEATGALARARRLGDASLEMAALLQVGKAARWLNDYPAASETARQGLALAAAGKNDAWRGEFYLLLGYVQWNQANLPEALGNLLEASRLGEVSGDKPLQIGVRNVLGLVAARSNDPDGSLAYYESARALAEETGDDRLGPILNNLGGHYLEGKDYGRAREYYLRALSLLRGGSNQRVIAFVLLNLGQVCTETGDQAAAVNYLDEALAICQRYDNRRGLADIHYLRAAVERRLGRPDQALALLGQSLALAREIKNPDLFALIYDECVQTEAARGDYRAALDYARLLAAETETIRGDKSRRQAAQVTARHESEFRAQQIKLLQRDKELQQTALAIVSVELSRARAIYCALALILALGAAAAVGFLGRQRARSRVAGLELAETRAARARAEQDLHASEARFRSAFEHSALGIAVVAPDGRWLRVNPALCHIVGYTPEELLATDFQSITHPDDLAGDCDFVARMLAGRIESYHVDKRYFHKLGHTVWVRLDVSMVRDSATGEPRYFVSQIQDITSRRRVVEQLRAAKAEAERANNAKSEFLSRMSHELRTPLNAILGFGQLLEVQGLGEPEHQSVEHILQAGRHLLALINEVLDVSTVESGAYHFMSEPVPIRAAVDAALDLMRPLADQAGVTLRRAPPEEASGCLRADPRRLKQVLCNLLSNAIKYNHPGGEVSLRCRDAREGRRRIEISDTGPGMAPQDLETIFVPFARLPATQATPGTGLGLAVCKTLTEGMDGELGVRSEPGQGSTFWVEFASAPAPAPDGASPLSADLPAVDPALRELFGSAAGPATLLHIEDNPENLILMERLLRRESDVRLVSAPDGQTGLKLARECRPDLILLDVHLPDMTGAEVLERLRQDPDTAGVPVIAVSADAMPAQIQRMRGLGTCEYLEKPLDFRLLREAINRALRAPC